MDHSGTVTFANMMTTADLLLKIRIDTVPELDELFVLNLINVSRVSTVKFLNFRMPENIAVMYLKFKQKMPNLREFHQKVQME